jgi:glutamine amidotransferase
MSDRHPLKVAIVDFGLGNLFSVQRACERAGLLAEITSSKESVLAADGVILPGVGAFGDAMENLRRADLIGPLRYVSQSGKPLVGICLGQQLLMSESEEFGHHRGLGLIEGTVVRFREPCGPEGQPLKIPHIGWSRIHRPNTPNEKEDRWSGSPLEGLADGTYMYFVHSYHVKPADHSVELAMTCYGDLEFCSAVRSGNTCAFQFHPERSGPDGLSIYCRLAEFIVDAHERTKLHSVA